MVATKDFIEAIKAKGLGETQIANIETAARTDAGLNFLARMSKDGAGISLANYTNNLQPEHADNIIKDLITNSHVEHDLKDITDGAKKASSESALNEFRNKALDVFKVQGEQAELLARKDARATAEELFHSKFSQKMPDSKSELKEALRERRQVTRELERKAGRNSMHQARYEHAQEVEKHFSELVDRFEPTLRDAHEYERNIDQLGRSVKEARKNIDGKLLEKADDALYDAVREADRAREAAVRAHKGLSDILPEIEHSEALSNVKRSGLIGGGSATETTGRFANKHTAKEAEKAVAKTAEATKATESGIKLLMKNPVVKYGGIAAGALLGLKLLGAFDSKEQSAGRA